MNHETDPIEQLLAGQRLQVPSDRLDRRIADSLYEPRRPVIGRIFGPIAATAAAAALAAAIWWMPDGGGPNSPLAETGQEPVRIEHSWSETELGEPIVLDDTGPLLPMRQRQVRRVRWIDPNDPKVKMELTVPDQQVMYVTLPVD
ncbi:MAG: hypothetical protein R3236_00890 [Phycisphaeraceae bacterium]|nr:hypothetical protein [Phycisphaeraceae bacterium]